MDKIKQVSQEVYEFAQEEGWGEFECCNGYGVFDCGYPTRFGMIRGKHIEKIDLMNVWSSDITAATHAEKHNGIKIIRDIPNLYKVFIDTPENREQIMEQIKKGPTKI